MNQVAPTGASHEVGINELFFSTTDAKGIIEQANSVFVRLSRFTRDQLIGAPHNIIRHPSMPGGAFLLMWQTLQDGRPFCAYVDNLAADGSRYTVFATITPLRDGYLSVRSRPMRTDLLDAVRGMYQAVRPGELASREQETSAHNAAEQGLGRLAGLVGEAGFPSYDEFIWTALPAEVVARRAEGAGFPRREVVPKLDDLMDSAFTINRALRDWLGRLDNLQTFADDLVGAIGRLEETMVEARATRDEFERAGTAAGFSPIMLSINVWVEMIGEIDTMVTGLVGELDALRASTAQARFRIALASLHTDALGQFIGELDDRERGAEGAADLGDADAVRAALRDLAQAVEEGLAETRDTLATNRDMAAEASERIKAMGDAFTMTSTVLAGWQSMVSQREEDASIAALVPSAEAIATRGQTEATALAELAGRARDVGAAADGADLSEPIARFRAAVDRL